MKTYTTTIKVLTVMVAILAFPITLHAQYNIIQKGQDIDGEAAGDQSGYSVSMPDANTIAIGAPFNNGNGNESGHVRIFKWNGSGWVKKGADINGTVANDNLGLTVSMPDSNTVAIRAQLSSGNTDTSKARVYKWNGTFWIKKGPDVAFHAHRLDRVSVIMPDSNTLAICTPSDTGYARIYSWDGTQWIQKGVDIRGVNLLDKFGSSLSMPDANTIAIGANEMYGTMGGPYRGKGHVSIFNWNGTSWTQKGANIDGENEGDISGTSVSMPDSKTVAIGSPGYSIDTLGYYYAELGQVRIFRWNGLEWVQKGLSIIGDTSSLYGYSGHSVSMPDSNTIAIGAPGGNGIGSGQVRIYGWSGSEWDQKGKGINGQASNDEFGWSVSMPDTNAVGIGAILNDGNGSNSGHVRIFTIQSSIGIEEQSLRNVLIYPNPASETITIAHPNAQFNKNTRVILYDLLGNKLLRQVPGRIGNVHKLDVSRFSAGVYILKVVQDKEILVTERVVINK